METEIGVVKYLPRDRQGEANEVQVYHTPFPLYVRDQVRTDTNSGATVRIQGGQNLVKLGELSKLEILPPQGSSPWLSLLSGAFYFYGRDQPREIRFKTSHTTGAPRGTEFLIEVQEDRTLVAVFEGTAMLTNAQNAGDTISVGSGEFGIAMLGKPLEKHSLQATNIVQWWLYYPAVLDIDELKFTPEEKGELKDSLDAYRLGDLSAALFAYPGYPNPREPATDPDRIYLAGLYLAAGQVSKAETNLTRLAAPASTSAALRWLIDAVQGNTSKPPEAHTSASEWLGLSYYYQARHDLDSARAAALNSVAMSTNFALGWERLAELDFGFGFVRAAGHALDISLKLAPRNAQAHALRGFLLCADNSLAKAREAFEKAMSLDSALGDAWFGRGLVRIREGDTSGGNMDLQTAAILEPNRSLFRSYLGKAYANVGEFGKADKELARARVLDTNDPTPWLYSALLKQQTNRINGAIADLQTSQTLNDNRSLFRSRMLLDEDNAVRSASLASIYRDAGMTDVSVREAAKAVSDDYANYSAHLFLAQSYDTLRDPTGFNLRYESAWFNELLLANLLSPVGAGQLSQYVSAQDYSKLLESDGLGIANSTEVRSDKSITELASQYGTFGGTSYALDLDYQHNNGVRVNNDLDSIDWYTTLKQQVTPYDTAFALIEYRNYHSGDNFQYYDQTNARPNYRFDEYQEPNAFIGWHHDWGPGMHTLLFGGRLADDQRFSDLATPQLLLFTDPNNLPINGILQPFDVNYRAQIEIYTMELNQIFQWDRVTLTAGARYQSGTFNTTVTFTNPPPLVPLNFPDPFDTTSVRADFSRTTGYGYLTVEPLDRVWLTGGVTYEDMSFPLNFRNPPLTAGQDHRSQLGPKAALVWEPLPQVTLRGMFSRSLGGVSLEEDYRLEPTQLAGFPQTFRSLISESVAGSVSASEDEIYAGALDLKFPTRTYVGMEVEQLNSRVDRTDGVFSLTNGALPFGPSSTPESLDYRENVVSAGVNQLLGEDFALGAGYKWDAVRLDDVLPNIPVSAFSTAQQQEYGTLQEASAYILLNDPSGFFACANATWYHQHNSGYNPAEPGDDFFQENLFAGYRCFHRRVEAQLGILNLGGQDYQLNPLNVHSELPRKRTFTARLNFIF